MIQYARRQMGAAIAATTQRVGRMGGEKYKNANEAAAAVVGNKRLMYGGSAAGGLLVLNAMRSPSSGSSGINPRSSGGSTMY